MDQLLSSFQGDSPTLQFLGKWGYYIYSKRGMASMYIHLILAALLPIYAGSHASLRCPPSATPPTEDEDGEEIEVAPPVEGLQPYDAIVFPIMAGIVLAGLYYIIKWLEDPALLNKILGYYFSAIGTFGVGTFSGDALNVLLSLTFPRARSFITQPLSLTLYIHRLISLKHRLHFQSIIGLFLGILAILGYNFYARPWWLTNLIAWGFSYGTLQLMSPTTFWTGSLVLAGLFFYDIAMVFYTPLMVTVATSLDVPIKLVFPGPGRGSMLGLGDVILPGIMIAIALRFDLYLHYLRKQSTTGKNNETIKPAYVEATGAWGDIFSTRLGTRASGASFKKTYFNASIIGYIIGMLVTLTILNIFQHGQPALLYLVPGVLIALWGTAFVKGDISLMWGYTEDGSLVGNATEGEVKAKSEKDQEKAKEKAKEREKEHMGHIVLFSLEQPEMKKSGHAATKTE